jgi:uncharacterized protein YprB with RNaseH-like and TPR domain
VLTSTYIHARGVGAKTERWLWRQGALTWGHFLQDPDRWDLTASRRASLELELDRSVRAHERGEFQYFARCLPRAERWRAFREFRETAGYLDIETDGGVEAESITMAGLYSFGRFEVFVKDENLASFPDALERCSIIVTFFGTGFDIPMLQKAFPALPFDQLHIDLCPTLRRLGHRGGLKRIEEALGIQRGEETAGLSGWDAVRLWRSFLRGDDHALETLIAYNREDCVNLERLMEYAYDRLAAACRAEMVARPE